MKRLDLLRKAAELSVKTEREAAPIEQAAAEAAVEAADLNLEELKALPLTPDRLSAQNALAEAQWQAKQADARRDIYQRLAARGVASGADAASYDLKAKLADARVQSARAHLNETLRGAPAPDLAVATAELDLARIQLQRQEATAEQALTVAQANLKAAGLRLETFRQQSERRRQQAESATVDAPVTGVVTDCWAGVGDTVDKGNVVMRLAQSDRPVVRAALSECDLSRVSIGDPAEVQLAGLPGRTFSGRLMAIEDWPQTPWWYRQYQDQSKVLPGRLFRAIIKLDEDAPPLPRHDGAGAHPAPAAGAGTGRRK